MTKPIARGERTLLNFVGRGRQKGRDLAITDQPRTAARWSDEKHSNTLPKCETMSQELTKQKT